MSNRIDVEALSRAQTRDLLNEQQQLDRARIKHVERLFEMLSAKGSGGEGRTLYELLNDERPDVLAHLQRELAAWVDLGNSITALAEEQIDKIMAGDTSPPDGTIFH